MGYLDLLTDSVEIVLECLLLALEFLTGYRTEGLDVVLETSERRLKPVDFEKKIF